MAVANVASLLATKYGRRVIAIDWDLEAPGLHRFFDIPQDKVGAGLIDLLHDYKNLMRKEVTSLPNPLIDVTKYITSVAPRQQRERGSISLISAGRQGDEYAKRVNDFNWADFYDNWQGFGFMEFFKEQLKTRADADIILIDSRTGITDIGGICTMQLPEVVVLLFALNEQNINGIETTITGILRNATETTKRKAPPKLILRPARVERYLEQDKKAIWEKAAAERLGKYLPSNEGKPLRFMKKKSIPYVGAYGFGETPLAVDKDPDAELAEAIEDLACSILQESGVWTSKDQEIRDADHAPTPIELASFSSDDPGGADILDVPRVYVPYSLVFLLVLALLLVYMVFKLWPGADVLHTFSSHLSLFGIQRDISLNKRLLSFAVVCGALGGCVRGYLNALGFLGSMVELVTRVYGSPLLGGLLGVLYFVLAQSGQILMWPPANPSVVALIPFVGGFLSTQLFGRFTTYLVPRKGRNS